LQFTIRVLRHGHKTTSCKTAQIDITLIPSASTTTNGIGKSTIGASEGIGWKKDAIPGLKIQIHKAATLAILLVIDPGLRIVIHHLDGVIIDTLRLKEAAPAFFIDDRLAQRIGTTLGLAEGHRTMPWIACQSHSWELQHGTISAIAITAGTTG